MLYHFDPVYMLLLIGVMIVGFLVQLRLKSVFGNYSKVPLSSGMSGKEVAEKMLRDNGIFDVKVQSVEGSLTDHYHPHEKTVNLSHDVYYGKSVSAAAVAAHECGHAVQHATSYRWLEMRSKLVPVVNMASTFMNIVFLAMAFLAFSYHLYNQALIVIIIAQAAITFFTLITLPVEIDASRRALQWLEGAGLTYGEEHEKAKTALNWAAGTYMVAALAAMVQLMYFIFQFMNRRDE
ncbi:MAG: zinc metallopeptidase [Bacteroidia bacterium]